jgi:hypothetical protein
METTETAQVGEVRIDELPDGVIPLGAGWEYIWPVYIVTWLVLIAYAVGLRLRRVERAA